MDSKYELNYKKLNNRAKKVIFIIASAFSVFLIAILFIGLLKNNNDLISFLYLFSFSGIMWLLGVMLMFYGTYNFYDEFIVYKFYFRNKCLFKYTIYYKEISRTYIYTSSHYTGSRKTYTIILLKKFPYRKKLLTKSENRREVFLDYTSVGNVFKDIKIPNGKTRRILIFEKIESIILVSIFLGIIAIIVLEKLVNLPWICF